MATKRLTKARREAKIKRANAAFARMTKAQKRVAIAKDVLDQIKAGKYVPTVGTYVSPVGGGSFVVPESKKNAEVCDLLAGKTCNVCALGSVFVSAVKFHDKLKVADLDPTFVRNSDFNPDTREWGPVGEGVAYVEPFQSSYLKKFFTPRQLGMMEIAFERRCRGAFEHLVDGDTSDQLQIWGGHFEEESDRLEAIMKNIIRNKGTFAPRFLID